MLSTMDMLHAVTLCTLDVTATAANFVLIYAIITSTPPSMRSYSILLLNNAFVDILSAFASVMGIARLSFLRKSFSQVYVFLGGCSRVGLSFCHLCQTIHIFCVCHSTIILLHSFCFRLYILRDKLVQVTIPSARVTLLICVCLYGPTVFMMVRCSHKGHSNVLDYHFVIALSYVVILSPAAMVMIFFVRLRLIGEISKMESGARDHHSRIAKALTYQMLLPAGVSLASAAWLSEVTGLWWNETPERLIMTLSSFFALGSPLINLTFLPPYRRIFGKGGR
ncbi:hypothetical protein PENTCL1PPCAC_15257, partial [Pristionchus entomophagus]